MKLGATHPPPLSRPQYVFFINTRVWLYNGARSRNSLHVSPVRSWRGIASLERGKTTLQRHLPDYFILFYFMG